ncbi:MAG: hydroxymethylbilane synthase [Marinicaulis sp.]|nr:hydroxymethylbilane synthase [Marinicaulis sp.]
MKIGTRSSLMALAQTNEVVAQLTTAFPELTPEIVKFKPRGDIDQTAKLNRHGGKGGAFVAEIRDAMRSGELDAAMHSLKDVPGDEEAPGLVFAAYLRREAINDALVLRNGLSIEEFKSRKGAGFKIGTNSVRRASYLKILYPETEVIHYRGAADTRIKKLDERALQKLPDGGEVGPADALVMAVSGLERVGFADRISKTFTGKEMLPAVGQGIVAVECAAQDWQTRAQLAKIDDHNTRICALAEREVLWVLNGHCNTPIAGNAKLDGDTLYLDAAVLSIDGGTIIQTSKTGDAVRPRELGRLVGLELLDKGAARLINDVQ